MITKRYFTIFASLCLLSTAVFVIPAAAQAQGSTPSSTTNVQTSGKIFFRSTVDDKNNLYSINPDGTGLQTLAPVTQRNDPFSISPDGKHILFYNDDSNVDTKLYMMDGVGTNIHLFSQLGDLDWSPDSQWVAGTQVGATSTFTSVMSNIVIVSSDGHTTRQLTNNQKNNSEPVWSPDGKSILYVSDESGTSQLYLMNADGSNSHLLSSLPVDDIEQPQWSPDGKSIIIYSGSAADNNIKLEVLNADGSSSKALTQPVKGVFGEEPQWSPDSKHILYIVADTNSHVNKLIVVNADGSNLRTLISDPNLAGMQPVWSPDSTQIAYLMQNGASINLYIMNANGSNSHRIALGTGFACTYIDWHNVS